MMWRGLGFGAGRVARLSCVHSVPQFRLASTLALTHNSHSYSRFRPLLLLTVVPVRAMSSQTAPGPSAEPVVLAATMPKKAKPSRDDFKRLFSIARPEAKTIAGAVVLLFISSAVTMSVPFSIGKIFDLLFTDSELRLDRIVDFSKILVGVFAVGAVANFGRVLLIQRAGNRIVAQLRRDVFSSIIKQEVAFFDERKTGELVNRLSADTSIVGKSLTDNVSDGLRAFSQAVAGVSMMCYLSPQLTLVAMLTIPPVVLAAVKYGGVLKRLSGQVQTSLAETTNIAEERLGNVRTVRAFAQEQRELDNYNARVENLLALSQQEARAKAIFFGSTGFSGNLIIIGVLYYGAHMMTDGLLTVGDFTSFLMYSLYVGISVNGMSSFYAELMKGAGASAVLWSILDRKPTIPLHGGVQLPTHVFKGELDFRNVAFAYPTRPDAQIFRDFSLKVPAGTIAAIVGSSGSGKSTLSQLLLRFYEPHTGAICVDNHDVRTLDPQWLRQHIGVVAQEPVLFSGTIYENIAYGRPEATEEEVKLAAQKANAIHFIQTFPDGFKTLVGERGLQLSGGQRQRIAIARALLKDPRILILDEATSALDSESEALVQEALERLMKGRTVLTIAHRLSTIKKSDVIAVLHEGEIVESGSYNELMNREDGAFRKLVEHQTIDQ